RTTAANGSGSDAARANRAASAASPTGSCIGDGRAGDRRASACASGNGSRCAGAVLRLGAGILVVESWGLGVGPWMLGGAAEIGRGVGRRILGAARTWIRMGRGTLEIESRMGYDVFITRAELPEESSKNPISIEEWVALVKLDSSLRISATDYYERKTPDGKSDRIATVI